MVTQTGLSKVRAAKKRITIEDEFLGSLSVQCDDEGLIDSIIGDDGFAISSQSDVRRIANIIVKNDMVRFVKDKSVIEISIIEESLRTIDDCRATIRKHSAR